MTGNVLINSNANRFSQYYVWSYGPGNDSYYKYMYIDFSQPEDKVRRCSLLQKLKMFYELMLLRWTQVKALKHLRFLL